jgi:hypothetical protein
MSFSYSACRALRRESGAIGAFVELTELAIREFRSQHAISGLDVDTFIRAASHRNEMYLHYKEWPTTLARIARSYIIQTNECMERFISEYAREHEMFFQMKWRPKRQDESRLDRALDCANQKELRAGFKYKLIKYYVDVRHATVHSPDGNQLRALERDWSSFAEHRDEIVAWFPSAGVPNSFDEIKFNDHKLFVRAIKEFAYELSERTRPPDEVLGELAVSATFRKRGANIERSISRAARYLQTQFGLDEAASKAIARYHVSGLLAQR